ncbi:MAG TPA: MBL fold metallo-hydrolase [Hyphomicrobiaceae bacterium]|nr:MBL fold metallo-hydrolase [Hyphomicrobiaceae bacterium]
MSEIDRRRMLALAGATGLAATVPFISHASSKSTPAFKIGSFEITTLSDGYIGLPSTVVAPDADPAERAAALKAAGQSSAEIRSPLNVTLVRSANELILIDAGSGTQFVGTAGKLTASLETAGVTPEQITRVIFTHAHPDHLWGVINDFDETAFPNASHHISEVEWNYWNHKDTVSKVPKDRQGFVIGAQKRLAAIKEKIKTFKPGNDIATGITVVDTAGHTPGHVSIQISAGNDTAMVIGDALTHPIVSFQHPDWRPAMDQIPDRAAATRKALLARLHSEKTRITGYHLPSPGIGMVEKKGNGFMFAPAG